MKIRLSSVIAIVFSLTLCTSRVVAQNIDFKQDISVGCAPLTVLLTYTGTNPNVDRIDWYFNDGSPMVSTTLPTTTVTHTYQAGYHNPYIFVFDAGSNYIDQTYSSFGGITVTGAPGISMTDSVCVNDVVNFQPNGNFNSVSWNFGDGGTSNEDYPQHIYTTLGTKTVTLNSNTSCGNFVTTQTIVVTNSLSPNPTIYADANSAVCPGQPVHFQSNGAYASYSWKFGDGGTSAVAYPVHVYASTGVKTVTLTVTNGCGNSASATYSLTVGNSVGFPNGSYLYNYDDIVCPGQEARGNVYGGLGGYPKFIWNYGDGSPLDSASGDSYRHTYYTVGTYTITCKVTNYCGLDTTYKKPITVSSTSYFPNDSWFRIGISYTPACPNSSVRFGAPNGVFSNFEWNFGDGSPVTSTSDWSINHTYGSALTTYTVSLKITNLCGNDTILYAPILISNPAAFPSHSQFKLDVSSSPICPNSTPNFYAPDGYSSYVWNFGDGTPQITNISSYYSHTYGNTTGTYTASVKLSNTCGDDTTLYKVIVVSGNVPFSTQSWFKLDGAEKPVCPGDVVDWNAPGGFSDYMWVFGNGDTAFSTNSYIAKTYTAIGTYTASVLITNGCGQDTTLTAVLVVNNSGSFPGDLGIYKDPDNGSCPGDAVSFHLSGGPFKSYFWSFGDGDTLTTNNNNVQHTYTATGVFQITCVIKNACGDSMGVHTSVQVKGNAPVNSGLSFKGVPNPACAGDEINYMVNNGQANYTYVWNFGDGSLADTTLGAGIAHSYPANGNYTVSLKAINGCGLSKNVMITEVITNSVVPTLTDNYGNQNWGFPGSEGGSGVSPAGCAGDAIIFYYMGSFANNLWDFGDGNTGIATEQMMVYGGDGGGFPVTIIKHAFAANGIYKIKLTVTNNCGNSVTDSMNISIGGNQAVDGDLTTSPPPFSTCASIDFLAFGGATYGWDFGDGSPFSSTTSPTISHTYASAGVYFVSVLVTNGCGNSQTYYRSVNVSGVGGPSVTLSASANPTCFGGTNGTAAVTVANGEAPYTYLWNTTVPQTTASVTGLSAGLHYVTVTDNIGCASDLAVSISNPAAITLSGSSVNSGCGTQTGSASVSVLGGGTSPFSYLWSNGSTTSSVSGLGFGQYGVTLTDANGCTASNNISVSESNGAALSVISTTSVTCFGASSGAVNINVTGATPPYTYAWSNNATTQDISGLMAGSYSVMVTDASGCKSTINAVVPQAAALAVATSVVSAPTCGNFDGKASAIPTGGTSPYTYLWPGAANQTTQVATGLPAGSYTVQVTDAAGCTHAGAISLSNSNSPVLSAIVSDVNCNGAATGSINLNVTGGTSPYLYTWNVGFPQTNNQDIGNLAAGNYFVTVNDSKGCVSFQFFTVAQPAVLTATVSNTGATCGNNDAIATASPAGGNTPYSYVWSGNGQTTQSATGLAIGSYTVSITDSKGCTAVSTTSVSSTVTPINICGITVDNSSTKNVIVWEKPVASNIDSFRVYRNIATVYTYVGAVAYQDSSYFIDNTNGVNPNITSYQYKIKALDNCGMESVMSAHHQTIHLQVSVAAPPKSFNLSWSDYVGFPVSQYRILVDSLNDGNWKVRDSVPYGNPKQWSDIYHYPDTVAYMIEIDHPTGCVVSIKNPDPMASNLNLSKSNINRIQDSTLNPFVHNIKIELTATIYPNPSNGLFAIELKDLIQGPVSVKVYNMLGEEVQQATYSTFRNRIAMDLGKQPQGVYYISIASSDRITTKKIVIE